MRRELYDRFKVELPVMEWNGLQLLRISIQAYNTQEDIDRLLAGLSALLKETGGERGIRTPETV